MEIRQIRAFVAIAETRTFTAGARQVNVTQAAISMQIRQLENEIGIPLFVRTPRRVILTQAGEILLERARKILREHDAALAQISEAHGAEHGRLRIGTASATFATEPLPGILCALREKYPKADVSVFSGTSEALEQKILSGELDVAFVSLPIESQNIQSELLISDEIVAIAHPTHGSARKRVISAAALANENLILGEHGGNTRRRIDKFFSDAGVKPNVIMELSRQSAINQMVESNMGVGIAGLRVIKKEVEEGRLIPWWIEGAEINWELGLARLRGGYFSPIAQTFVQLCHESFADEKEAKAQRSKAK
jgi:DNA-binding transcriptional LysR family regulator